MSKKPDPVPERGPAPSSTSALLDQLFNDGRQLSHDERIEQLVRAALRGPQNRLRFEDELARGGMGAVRQAFDATLQRRMAVKTMHAKTYDHVMLVHGFLREAQVTGQLDHPNIVPIHELGRDERGELYFTMKLVDGKALKALIAGGPPASYPELRKLLDIFVKVCDALAFAHSRGVIHCDIKSANVMVGRYGQVYLMDWGGAQLLPPRRGVDTSMWVRDSLPPLPESETAGMVFGTPSYMSPEQASAGREPVDERSDVFSMGALLYEMMTGRPPYSGGTPIEGIMRAQIVDIVPPEEQPHLYPNELIDIVMRAMSRRPIDRHQSVEELQEAINGLLHSGGHFPTVHFRAGEHVIREGEVGDAAYWIESGSVEVYQTIGGQKHTLRRLDRGTFFGETAIFARSPRTASVVALDDVTVKRFTAQVLDQELKAMAPWMQAAVRTLARRFAAGEEARIRAGVSAPPTPAAPVTMGPVTAAAVLASVASPAAPTTMRPTTAVLTSPETPEPTGESVMIDLEDLASGVQLGDADEVSDIIVSEEESVVVAAVEEVTDPEADVNTKVVGPWTKKPPPRPQ
jgi:tRNA A-37 threonylcarbamoyl transferase component Bud32